MGVSLKLDLSGVLALLPMVVVSLVGPLVNSAHIIILRLIAMAATQKLSLELPFKGMDLSLLLERTMTRQEMLSVNQSIVWQIRLSLQKWQVARPHISMISMDIGMNTVFLRARLLWCKVEKSSHRRYQYGRSRSCL